MREGHPPGSQQPHGKRQTQACVAGKLPLERDLGAAVDSQLNESAMCPAGQESQWQSRLGLETLWPAVLSTVFSSRPHGIGGH